MFDFWTLFCCQKLIEVAREVPDKGGNKKKRNTHTHKQGVTSHSQALCVGVGLVGGGACFLSRLLVFCPFLSVWHLFFVRSVFFFVSWRFVFPAALCRDGTARGGAANRNGVAIRAAHRHKEKTYLAGEVAAKILRALAVAKAQDVPNVLQASVEVAWFRWRSSILSCAAVRALVARDVQQ